MSAPTWKLLGSAATLSDLERLISRFYCGEPITLGSTAPGIGNVATSKGVLDGVRIRKIKGRYRFEYRQS